MSKYTCLWGGHDTSYQAKTIQGVQGADRVVRKLVSHSKRRVSRSKSLQRYPFYSRLTALPELCKTEPPPGLQLLLLVHGSSSTSLVSFMSC